MALSKNQNENQAIEGMGVPIKAKLELKEGEMGASHPFFSIKKR